MADELITLPFPRADFEVGDVANIVVGGSSLGTMTKPFKLISKDKYQWRWEPYDGEDRPR